MISEAIPPRAGLMKSMNPENMIPTKATISAIVQAQLLPVHTLYARMKSTVASSKRTVPAMGRKWRCVAISVGKKANINPVKSRTPNETSRIASAVTPFGRWLRDNIGRTYWLAQNLGLLLFCERLPNLSC